MHSTFALAVTTSSCNHSGQGGSPAARRTPAQVALGLGAVWLAELDPEAAVLGKVKEAGVVAVLTFAVHVALDDDDRPQVRTEPRAVRHFDDDPPQTQPMLAQLLNSTFPSLGFSTTPKSSHHPKTANGRDLTVSDKQPRN
ncbi:hypothetical protein [Janthinobacterium sp. CG_23.3]|uniref:hypothetical protein n=1 Tax=Janthinobacterium sp. CG_23.3 TaxID=3349634 RepID=UPI0038D3541D